MKILLLTFVLCAYLRSTISVPIPDEDGASATTGVQCNCDRLCSIATTIKEKVSSGHHCNTSLDSLGNVIKMLLTKNPQTANVSGDDSNTLGKSTVGADENSSPNTSTKVPPVPWSLKNAEITDMFDRIVQVKQCIIFHVEKSYDGLNMTSADEDDTRSCTLNTCKCLNSTTVIAPLNKLPDTNQRCKTAKVEITKALIQFMDESVKDSGPEGEPQWTDNHGADNVVGRINELKQCVFTFRRRSLSNSGGLISGTPGPTTSITTIEHAINQ